MLYVVVECCNISLFSVKEFFVDDSFTENKEMLLYYYYYSCKTSSRNQCGTSSCSCRKNGLACVTACGGCHGVGCNNEFNAVENENGDTDFEIDDRNLFDSLF